MNTFTLMLIITYYVIMWRRERGFIPFYPSQSFLFPSSKEEVKLVKKAYLNRTQEDIDFFYKSDLKMPTLFHNILKVKGETKAQVSYHLFNNSWIMGFIKVFANRARPFQIDPSIIPPPNTQTYNNPAFPSGHTWQSWYAANIYARKYPDLRKELFELANKIAETRVKNGIHYPSDVFGARKIINKLYGF